VLASIDSASHWVILAKDIERFRRDLPILPLNKNVVSRTLVFWIGSSKRTFVTDDMLEVPESIAVFVLMLLFVLLNVVHQLIVGKDLFVVIIINRANKLYVSRLPEEFTFVFTNTFANLLFIDNIKDPCTMSLPIFLIHEEGTTDKFRGINDRHRRQNLPIIRRVMMRLDDGHGNLARLQWIKSKVLSVRIKRRSDIGSMDNLESVVRQNFKGHGMSDRFADTNEVSAFLT
jgi:hypothetical protein